MDPGDLELVVPVSHPMLAGHFPGQPIVPGAWLLAAIQQLAVRWLAADAASSGATAVAARIIGVRVVKFTRPVRPGETCRVAFLPGAGGLRFTVKHGETPCATGTLLLGAGQDEQVAAGQRA